MSDFTHSCNNCTYSGYYFNMANLCNVPGKSVILPVTESNDCDLWEQVDEDDIEERRIRLQSSITTTETREHTTVPLTSSPSIEVIENGNLIFTLPNSYNEAEDFCGVPASEYSAYMVCESHRIWRYISHFIGHYPSELLIHPITYTQVRIGYTQDYVRTGELDPFRIYLNNIFVYKTEDMPLHRVKILIPHRLILD